MAHHLEHRTRHRDRLLATTPDDRLVVGDVVLAVCSVGELVMVDAREGRRVATAPVEGEPVGARLDADPSGRFLVGTLGHARRALCWQLEGED